MILMDVMKEFTQEQQIEIVQIWQENVRIVANHFLEVVIAWSSLDM